MKYGTKSNGNWVKEETLQSIHKRANKALSKEKQKERGKRFNYVPHPTIKNTFIQIEIKTKQNEKNKN